MLRFAAGNKGTDTQQRTYWCCTRTQPKNIDATRRKTTRRLVFTGERTSHRMSINH